ncbi:MAG: DUF938 domain-containing protein [Pontibacterium sp.]
MRNYSPASERNTPAIAPILIPLLNAHPRVLEIGSGSGQHALAMSLQLPTVNWQTTEQPGGVSALADNLEEYAPKRFAVPKTLIIQSDQWYENFETVDLVYSANTLHIMSWPAAQSLIYGSGKLVAQGGVLAIYGPFNYEGAYTSPSNAEFDQWLKDRDAHSGIRNFEDICTCAAHAGLVLENDHSMPANNRFLIFRKV